MYNTFDFELEPIVPNKIVDSIYKNFGFDGFIYNSDEKAIYDENSRSIIWSFDGLYSVNELIIAYDLNGKTTYYHQYNLIYAISVDDIIPVSKVLVFIIIRWKNQ